MKPIVEAEETVESALEEVSGPAALFLKWFAKDVGKFSSREVLGGAGDIVMISGAIELCFFPIVGF